MAKLPNADRAVVDDRKLTGYLLDDAHRYGASKSAFFKRFGFGASEWEIFRDALLAHARTHDIDRTETTQFGAVYEVIGPLATPDGRDPIVLVAWMIRIGEDFPRLVTAVPA